MTEWKLCFVLLLPLTLCLDSEVTLVKTIGSNPDVTPVCCNSALNITFIICKIRTERNRGECRLLYHIEKGFDHQCDSGFKLMRNNQTAFLHLTNLTSEDSGSYTCECFSPEGIFTLHLNITVEEDATANVLIDIPFVTLIGAAILVVITGVSLGFIYTVKTNGCCSRSATSGLAVSETPSSLNQDDPSDPYASLQQPASDVYQTISNPASNTVTVNWDNQETNEEESDSSLAMYENI